ncbi:hypothetical protein HanPSC8_Chr07g0278591 [Helianthus annuus]|nr:hypothetical protein HanPSC8_Chr07g0278591 [Helianthus annuus]
MLMSEMMETAAAVGFHGGSAAVHGGGSFLFPTDLMVKPSSPYDVVLNRVQTTLANRSDFIRVNNGLLGSVSQSTQCRLVRFTSVMFRVHVRVPVQQV